MEAGATHIEDVGNVVQALDDLGLEPVLVGGMALVVLGSRRVTRDFDLVIARSEAALGQLLDALLFDFPLPAATLARRATTLKVRSAFLRIASEADLLRLKKIARAHRSSPGDAEDIAFLEARRAKRR